MPRLSADGSRRPAHRERGGGEGTPPARRGRPPAPAGASSRSERRFAASWPIPASRWRRCEHSLLTALLAGWGEARPPLPSIPRPTRTWLTLSCLAPVWRGLDAAPGLAERSRSAALAGAGGGAGGGDVARGHCGLALRRDADPAGRSGPGRSRTARCHAARRLASGAAPAGSAGEATLVRIADGPAQRLATLPTGLPSPIAMGEGLMAREKGWG